MDIIGIISSLIKPVKVVVEDLNASAAEKTRLTNELVVMQNKLTAKVLSYETKLMQAQADVIKAEAAGASFMQRNWRPLTMLTFLVLVVLDALAILPNPLAPEAWTLLQLGLGGYVVGRSLEKIAPAIKGAGKSASIE